MKMKKESLQISSQTTDAFKEFMDDDFLIKNDVVVITE